MGHGDFRLVGIKNPFSSWNNPDQKGRNQNENEELFHHNSFTADNLLLFIAKQDNVNPFKSG
jgi:hypothetical protein